MRSNKYNKKKKIGIYIYYPNESIACSPSNTKKRWLLDFSLSDRMKSVWMYFADFIWLKFCKKWDIFFWVWGTPTKAQKAPKLAFVGLSKLIGPGLDWSAWRKIFNPRLLMLASAGFILRLDSHIQVQVLMPHDQLIWCLHTLLISSMKNFLHYLKLMLYKYTNHIGMLLYFTIISWIVPPYNRSCTLYCTQSIKWKKGQYTSWFQEHCKSLLTSSLFCALSQAT